MGFMQGEMVAMDALNPLETSPFRNPTQVLIIEGPPIQSQIGGCPPDKDDKREEEREDNPSMRDVAE